MTNIEKCSICGSAMDTGNPLRINCGGDCALCMADAGDPDCVEDAFRLLKLELSRRDKMTDSERLEQLLHDFGISFRKVDDNGAQTGSPTGGWYITFTANESTRVGGYYGFSADFEFAADGKFVRAGVWE